MPFDQPTRTRLQRFVADAAQILTTEFTRTLQNEYGLDPQMGTITDWENLAHLDDARRGTARVLRETLSHYLAASPPPGAADALTRIVREQAFTALNQLCALRMAEARGLLIESVGNGYESKGFQLYVRLANGGLGEMGDAYCCYLFSVFDELAVDLPALFDRFSPYGRLFPGETALRDLLHLVNASDMADLWAEDETIGWIYQYFNSDAERRRMRDESSAPRNSRELAVRNQFFTPRYVVEFLTDNTLGRTWLEMTQGETALAQTCRYLVRRPTEIFLAAGERALDADAPDMDGDALSQEELLKQPVYIPYRAPKDPREIRLLDPACGSMHFGLYAFDLFETIYAEAWEREALCPTRRDDPALKPLRETYADQDAFRRDVPRLIIEHNLHGVDIDPRAVQIAGLSLWLRAQRGWKEQGVKSADRPAIQRSNIVCAEPMPGETAFLDEFIARHLGPTAEGRLLGQLVRRVFEAMRLAGEAGSLLKIEEEIADDIAEAKSRWQAAPPAQERLFDMAPARPQQSALELDVTGISDAAFWDRVEQRIYEALRQYAAQADTGAYQRRLFVHDAEQGFAFIDLCRRRYDVVLMNPPFGEASLPSKPYLEAEYGDTKGDVYKAFIDCFQDRIVPGGLLGAITNRTGFFLEQSADWRKRVLMRLYHPILLMDLGGGVLDAMVETAAYVLRCLTHAERRALTQDMAHRAKDIKTDKNGRFTRAAYERAFRLKRHQAVQELTWMEYDGYLSRLEGVVSTTTGRPGPDRYTLNMGNLQATGRTEITSSSSLVCLRILDDRTNDAKRLALESMIVNQNDKRWFVVNPKDFRHVPGLPFAYWAKKQLYLNFKNDCSFGNQYRVTQHGLATTDDFRFVRLAWEPYFEDIVGGSDTSTAQDLKSLIFSGKSWVPFAKGGPFSPYYSNVHLMVNWKDEGKEIEALVLAKYTYLNGDANWVLHRECNYFEHGLTWTRRTSSNISFRVLPRGCVFGHKGPSAFTDDNMLWLAVLQSAAYSDFIKLQLAAVDTAARSYEIGLIAKTPVPTFLANDASKLTSSALHSFEVKRELDTHQDSSHIFQRPALVALSGDTLQSRSKAWEAHVADANACLADRQSEIDAIAYRLYGIGDPNSVEGMTTAPEAADVADEENTTPSEDMDAEQDGDEEADTPALDARSLTADLLAYLVGVTFGRFDVRLGTGERAPDPLPDPFAPLPVCAPGMLQNGDGLPAAPNDVPDDYPVRIAWPGLLVDDRGHADDIERRVQDVLAVIWPDRAGDIEAEACQILGVPALREYFRRPAGFFADHLQRYSKSRRQAPIYWPLSTSSGSYTLWLYYPRLTDQTLYTGVNDYVAPKLREAREMAERLRAKAGARTASEERELEGLETFATELQALHDELLRLAAFWKPDLNDGVQITAAPLWKLFRLPKWQKTLRETWDKLERGEYDWAHLALSVWPERVRAKCRHDKSLAIAHGLEELYQAPPAAAPKTRTRKATSASVSAPMPFAEADDAQE